MKKLAAVSVGLLLLLAGCIGLPKSALPSAAPAATVGATASAAKAATGKYTVTIDGSHQATDYDGKPVLVVDFTFTNNDTKPAMFLIAIRAKAFQNGVELDTGIPKDDKAYQVGVGSKEIKPGATVKVQGAYVLADSSEVTIEVQETLDLTDTVIATQKIVVT